MEILRQTVPYDPKTPSEPGSAWDGEPDPFAKDLPPPPDSPPPMKKPPSHNALVLEEVRQHGKGLSDSSRKSYSKIAPAFLEIPEANFIKEIREKHPGLYSQVLHANIDDEARDLPQHLTTTSKIEPPTKLEPPKPRFNMEGVPTAEEVLAEIRKQLPPRPPSDSNSEPSDYWLWDDEPDTPSKVVLEKMNTPAALPTPVSEAGPPHINVPPAPPAPIWQNGRFVAPPVTDANAAERKALNDEIKAYWEKKEERAGLAQADTAENENQQQESILPSPMDTSTQLAGDDNRRLLEDGPNIFERHVVDLDIAVHNVKTKVDGLEEQTTGLEGKTKVLENGITTLLSRTAGFDTNLIGLDLKVNGLENGFTSLSSLNAGFEKDISGLDTRTKGLENGFFSLDSKTAGFETGINDLNGRTTVLEGGISHLGKKVETMDESTSKRLSGVNGRLDDFEGKIHGIEEIHEQNPELKKLLDEGKQFGGHLQSLTDGVQRARVGIVNLNNGFESARNGLQNHAHHINRLDNELVAQKKTAVQQHQEVVQRVDSLKKTLTVFGIGAGVVAAAGIGLWAWNAANKWLKRNKERQALEEATRRGPVAPAQVQPVRYGRVKRSHARDWNRLEV